LVSKIEIEAGSYQDKKQDTATFFSYNNNKKYEVNVPGKM